MLSSVVTTSAIKKLVYFKGNRTLNHMCFSDYPLYKYKTEMIIKQIMFLCTKNGKAIIMFDKNVQFDLVLLQNNV